MSDLMQDLESLGRTIDNAIDIRDRRIAELESEIVRLRRELQMQSDRCRSCGGSVYHIPGCREAALLEKR